jgi:acetyl esterase/lipase
MVDDPVTGKPLTRDLADSRDCSPFTLLHGVHDDVIPVRVSREFAANLRRAGWPVEMTELPTDHGAIAGAAYDATADRYAPATDPHALATADTVADRIFEIGVPEQG